MADLEPAADDALTVTVTTEDGTVVIRLAGDLDMTGVRQARAAIDAALGSDSRSDSRRVEALEPRRPQGRVVLDASALEYMDSSGIALMASLTRVAKEVEVRNPTPIVRQLIEMTGLSGILQVTDEDQP